MPDTDGYGFVPYDPANYVGGPDDSIHVSGRKVYPSRFGSGSEIWGSDGVPADTMDGMWKGEFEIVINEVRRK